jgi:hypothetical protein
MLAHWHEQLARDGYAELLAVFDATAVDHITSELTAALTAEAAEGAALCSDTGVLYAARNVLELWPRAATVWRVPPLLDALRNALGPEFGLVRALYFDKPPGHSWTLPCHQDVVIAVRDNHLPSERFTKPTRKAGVPHVEAPPEVLEAMLTTRIHLDEVTDENGPLRVVPGSHRSGMAFTGEGVVSRTLHAARGDVLLMRPLLAHGSGKSAPDTGRHRRVLHLEFAASPELADGYAWHDFITARQFEHRRGDTL